MENKTSVFEKTTGSLKKMFIVIKLHYIVLILLCVFSLTRSWAQLTGIKTIKASGGDYASFTLAINALNTSGVGAGGVIFDVDAGFTISENCPLITATGTSANPIVFQKSGTGANPIITASGTGGTTDAGFAISGGDYITFDGVDIAVSSNSVEYGYYICNASATNGAQFTTIKNCKITLNKTNTTAKGIYQYVVGPSNATGANSDNTFQNIAIENVRFGIHTQGNGTYPDLNTTVTRCTIGGSLANDIQSDANMAGIQIEISSSASISNNTIRNLTQSNTTASRSTRGIYLYNTPGTSNIYNNVVFNITGANRNDSYVYAIATNINGSYTTNIYNNVVYGLAHNFSGAEVATMLVTGIYVNVSNPTPTTNVYYNSILIDAIFNKGSTQCLGLYGGSVGAYNIRNNVFANTSTVGSSVSKRYCIYRNTGTLSSVNKNDYYIDTTAVRNYVGYFTADRTNLSNWRTATSKDANSVNIDPQFASATNLKPDASATNISNTGDPLASFAVDIEGVDRGNVYTDLGAYEFTPPCNSPINVSTSNILETSATISWTAPGSAPANGYEYEIRTSGAAGSGAIGFISSGTTVAGVVTENISSLTANTGYQVYVRSVCSGSESSSWTTAVGFTTLKIEPTNQPTNFAANVVSASEISLGWSSAISGSQSPDGYLIKASATSMLDVVNPVDGVEPADVLGFVLGLANKKATPGSATTATSFTGMTSGSMYYYKIYSYTNSGTSINFKTDGVPTLYHATKPIEATSGVFTATSSTSATITWNAPSDYNSSNHTMLVFVKATNAITQGTPTLIQNSYSANTIFGQGSAYQNDASAYCVYKGDGTSVDITGLIASTTYQVLIYSVVEAANSNTTCSYSIALTTSGATPSPPSCAGTPDPGNTLASPTTVCSGKTASLSIQNNPDVVGLSYQWQSSPDDATWNNIPGATDKTYTATVSANTYYRCNVICSGNIGTSSSVYIQTATTLSYTVNNTLSTTGLNFNTITSVVNYLNGMTTVCGNTTINIQAGQEFVEDIPALTATGSSTNAIIFQKSGVGANPKIKPIGAANYIYNISEQYYYSGFSIFGGDYITIDGIDIDASTNKEIAFGYFIKNASSTDGAKNNTIKNTKIVLNGRNEYRVSAGIYQLSNGTYGSSSSSNLTGTNSDNKYYNIEITGSRNYGVGIYGNSSFRDSGNEVGTAACGQWNKIYTLGSTPIGGATYGRGVYFQEQNSMKVFRTEFNDLNSRQDNPAVGIYGENCDGNTEVFGNKIFNINAGEGGSVGSNTLGYGIRIITINAADINVKIYNNAIANIRTVRTTAAAEFMVYGIFLRGNHATTVFEVDHNSLSIGQDIDISHTTACLGVYNNTPIYKIRNNIFANFSAAQSGVSKHYCLSFTNATWGASGSILNYNDYYIANDLGASGYYSIINSTANSTLPAHISAMTAPGSQDGNSIIVNPQFPNNNSNLQSLITELRDVATPLAHVSIDILCTIRNPDIGAYEYNATTLPVELVGFNASCNDHSVLLSWTTYSETDNRHFSLLKSANCKNWEEIAKIPGSGSSNQLLHYSFTDKNYSEPAYYMIKSVDYQGNEEYSSVTYASCIGFPAQEIQFFPNPAINFINCLYSNIIEESDIEILIFDISGRLLIREKYLSQNTNGNVSIDISDLPAGMYRLHFKTEKEITIKSFVKINSK